MKINGNILSGVRMGKGFKDELLAPIPLKEFVTNTSRLEHGNRVIVDSPKYQARSVNLEFQITGATQEVFDANKDAFYTELYKGTVTISELDFTSDVFHLVYTGKSVTYSSGLTNLACRVKVSLDEPNPSNRSDDES